MPAPRFGLPEGSKLITRCDDAVQERREGVPDRSRVGYRVAVVVLRGLVLVSTVAADGRAIAELIDLERRRSANMSLDGAETAPPTSTVTVATESS